MLILFFRIRLFSAMFEDFWLSRMNSLVRSCPEDTVLVTNDGRRIGTWRLLLALHSPFMAQLFTSSSSSREGVVALSVPLSTEETNNLLADMEEGGDVYREDEAMTELFGVRTSRFDEQIVVKEDTIQMTYPFEITRKEITKSPIKRPSDDGEISHNILKIQKHNTKHSCYTNFEKTANGNTNVKIRSLDKSSINTPLQSEFKRNPTGSIVTSVPWSVKEMYLEPKHDSTSGDTKQMDSKEERTHSSEITVNMNKTVASSVVESIENKNETKHFIFENKLNNLEKDILGTKVDKSEDHFPKTTSKTGSMIGTDDHYGDYAFKPVLAHPNIDVILRTEDIKKGLTFPDKETMMTSLTEWSVANFSPIVINGGNGIGNGNIRMGCPHASQKKKSKGTGKRRRQDSVEQVACPLKLLLRTRKDGSWLVTKAVTEHKGHEVSEERFQKYRKTKLVKLSPDQEAVVVLLLSQGAQATEISRMISDLTGRNYSRMAARCAVKRIMSRSGLDSQTGERLLK